MLANNKTLDNFQLSTNLVTDLYKDSLVILDFPQKSTPLLNEKKSELLGGYQSEILLLVSTQNLPYLHDDELQLLTKMLGACKMSLTDVGILNVYHTDEKKWDGIIDSYHPQKILIFGETGAMEIPISQKHICSDYKGITYLQTLSLVDLNRNPEEKKALWGALKQLFNLN